MNDSVSKSVTILGGCVLVGLVALGWLLGHAALEVKALERTVTVKGLSEREVPADMAQLVEAAERSDFAAARAIHARLLPLMLAADAPGKEVLHPVAVVIFGGLISSTLLDSLLTPLMFWLWGKPALERLLAAKESESF